MEDNLTIIIPAAGVGSRLGRGVPKCLVEVCGRPILEWQMELVGDLDVLVVVGFKADDVKAALRSIRPQTRTVENPFYASTGTASSVAIAAPISNQKQLIWDGDLLVDLPSIQSFLSSKKERLLGYSAKRSSTPVGVTVEQGLAIQIGYDVDSSWEWTGPILLPREDTIAFSGGHVFEEVVGRFPVPAVQVNCFEIDEPSDLEGAALWLANNSLGLTNG